MQRNWIRSTLFNISFIFVNLLCCILWLPTLLLPRPLFMKAIVLYHHIIYAVERYVMGLDYEVRGTEHLPKDGAYLVAEKHMSTYETFKLHMMFKDPAIILKRELLWVPLWGIFLKKSDVIAIDRSTPDKARKSIAAGALHIKEQGRPIVIFPQGTRVWPHETPKEKHYKSGIYHVQTTTQLPIIPIATNSGMYWPRSGWLKSSGTVVFKVMPPIEPGLGKSDLMRTLEDQIEKESNALMDEARKAQGDKS
jgi:1-acyl-sn-glycerol-3-phosphate acyltransferase